MHYGPTYFSKDGRSTVISVKQGGATPGQRMGMSDLDVKQLKAMCLRFLEKRFGTVVFRPLFSLIPAPLLI